MHRNVWILFVDLASCGLANLAKLISMSFFLWIPGILFKNHKQEVLFNHYSISLFSCCPIALARQIEGWKWHPLSCLVFRFWFNFQILNLLVFSHIPDLVMVCYCSLCIWICLLKIFVPVHLTYWLIVFVFVLSLSWFATRVMLAL